MFRYDDDVIAKLYEATQKKVSLMCDELVQGRQRLLKTGWPLKLLMEITMHITPSAFHLVGKDYTVTKACTYCGLCVRNCPAGNIADKNDKIRFGFSCNQCMRCIYACPEHAIRLRLFSSFAVPGGYDIQTILDNPAVIPPDSKRKDPGFLQAYLDDNTM